MRLFSGQHAFIVQRASALVLLAYVTALLLRAAFGAPMSVEQWQAWAAQPLAAGLLLVLVAAVLAHAWVGARDVVLDYVKPLAVRLAVLILLATALALLGVWSAIILVSHAL